MKQRCLSYYFIMKPIDRQIKGVTNIATVILNNKHDKKTSMGVSLVLPDD